MVATSGMSDLARQLDERLLAAVTSGRPFSCSFEVVAVEDVAVPRRELERVVAAAVHQVAVHLAGVAAGERDDARAVLAEQLAVHAGLVVVALEVRLGDELEQVAIALLVPGEHRQVVGRLLLRARASGGCPGATYASTPMIGLMPRAFASL